MVGGYRRELASPAAYIGPRHRSDSASDGELRRCRRRLKTTPSKAGPDSATVDRSVGAANNNIDNSQSEATRDMHQAIYSSQLFNATKSEIRSSAT